MMVYIRSGRAIGSCFAVTALLVGVTACGGGAASHRAASIKSSGPGQAGLPGSGTSGSGDPAVPTSVSGDGGPPAAGPAGGPSGGASATTVAPGTTGGGSHPGATTPTTAANHSVPVPTTPANTGPAPAAPGVYHYSQAGSTTTTSRTTTTTPVAPQGKLTVSPASGGGQVWVRAVDASTSTTTVMLFTGSGIFVQSETVPVVGGACTFSPALADPPWPLAVGKSFDGQANCSGSGTLKVHGDVTGTASVVVGGQSIPTYIIVTTLSLVGTNLVVRETDSYAPSLRLPVQTNTVADGSFTFSKSTYTVHSDITSLLTSATPS